MERNKDIGPADLTYCEAVRWIDRILHDEAPAAEFLDWVRRSPAHVEALFEAAETWEHLQTISDVERRGIESLAGRVRPHDETAAASHRRPRVVRYVAAGVLILAIAIYIVSWPLPTHDVTYSTVAGETRVLVLEDGSRVHLNASTALIVRLRKAHRDLELLGGEALFDVAHDAARPFRVRAGATVTQAVGTQFDLRSNAEATRVLVRRGKVAVTLAGHARERVELVASEGITVRHDNRVRGEPRKVAGLDVDAALAWTGALQLNGMLLRGAVERFNRANTVQISIDDPSLENVRLGGVISLIEPEQFVDALIGAGMVEAVDRTAGSGTFHLRRARSARLQNATVPAGSIR